MKDIHELLDTIAQAESHLDLLRLSKQDLVDGVITPEVKALLDEINEEFDPKIENVQQRLKALNEEAKQVCVMMGESVKGEHKRVTFYKGRESWDGKGLSGYAVAHPEILQFRETGNPYAVVKDV